MLTLILMTVGSLAFAQDHAKELAEPEPDGCWRPAQWPFPEQGATDVPVDVAPRFYLEGPCEDGFDVLLEDTEGAVFETEQRVRQHDRGVTVSVEPITDLPSLTTYTLTITTDLGTPTELWFTTGTQPSEQRSDIQVFQADVSGDCRAENAARYSLRLELRTDAVGLAGYARLSEDSSENLLPIFASGNRSVLLIPTDTQLGDTEACASIVRIEDDGTLGEWQETCANTPDIGDCSDFGNTGCACSQAGATPPLIALLPLLGLLGLRRRGQD